MINSKRLSGILLFLLLIYGITSPLFSQEQYQKKLIRISPRHASDLGKLAGLNLDYAYQGLKNHVDVIVDDNQISAIEKLGFEYQLLPAMNKANLYDSEYHTYEEMVHELDSLHQAYPTITSLHQVGVSQLKQIPIWAIKISDHADIDEDEFTVNYDGLHHAREPMGLETCMLLANHLLSNYGSDPRITSMINDVEIWITPILNTEGYKYIVDSDLSYPYWRKNQRDNNENGNFDLGLDGVDLNRNYDYNFYNGGSANFGDWVYRGPYPFSESEIAARRDLFLRERFLCSITYHSYAEEVYYMRGLSGSLLPETPLLDAFADSIASRIPKLSGTGHYQAGGSTNSTNMSYPWTFAVVGVYEVLIETGTEFIPPGRIGLRVANDNLHAAMYPLEKAIAGPGIKGHVTDAANGNPLVADVKIVEYDQSSMKPRKSEAGFGRFNRFAAPGTYRLEVTAAGYKSKTISNVVVTQKGWKTIDVALEKNISDVPMTGDIQAPPHHCLFQNYPNPFNQITAIRYQIANDGKVRLKIMNLLGQEIYQMVDEEQAAGYHAIFWDGKDWNGKNVPSGLYLISFEIFNNETEIVYHQIRKMSLVR